MLWKELREASLLYPIKTQNAKRYFETINNPEPKQIVFFLNSWGLMRRHFEVDKISKCMTESKNELEKFKKFRFETVDLAPLQDDVKGIFQKFLKSTNSPIAASKVLHVLAPSFFVMWDRAIRVAYGFGMSYNKKSTRDEEYYLFLIRVQKELREAIQSYNDANSIENLVDGSARLIQFLNTSKTLAKIVDEYNLMKFTKGTKELWT
jgi:hypothetical protein